MSSYASGALETPAFTNPPVYRLTPACPRGCGRCEVMCAVMMAVVELDAAPATASLH